MEVAGPVIDIVVESLMTRIKKELGYWWNSRKNVKEMGSRMKQLNHTAEDMKRKRKANNVNHLVVPHHVPTWLEEVESINNEVASIPTNGIGIGCFNIKMSYKAGKKSFDVLERISGLEESESKIKWTDEQIPLARVPSRNIASTSSTVDDGTQNRFESRDLIFKKALNSLEPNETRMMALCGMGGVGKSHMMERLKKAVEDSRMFYWVVKVVVGENTDIASLQHAMAEKTGGALTTTTRDARAELLNKRLVETSQGGQKKILVILDDVWKVLDLKDLGLPSPLPNGFKMLITSRDENACTQMGVDSDSIFRIGALNDDEATTLFFETVGLSKDDDPGLYEIGEEIIRRCGNLPIALKTIASTLKGSIRDESDWIGALSHLQHHDLKDHYGIVHEVFKISYNRLQRDDEKAIFLLSGLFPDDFDIPMEELMRYGWGLKLFPRNTLATARLRVETCVKSLIRTNLLVGTDRAGCVRMHDLARAFALSNSTDLKQASIIKHDDILEQLTEEANESYQRILIKCTDLFDVPEDFNFPNLTFFKLIGGGEKLKFPEDFYKSMEKLEVLSYEVMMYPPLLPRSSQCSTHLRTLCLHGCKLISEWSAIGYLVNLEVLSYVDSRIEKLPSIMGKLKRLKLLDLTGCLDLCIDDGVFRGLDKLEELYMRVSGKKAIRFTDANCDELEKLSMKLFALEVEFLDDMAKPKNMSFKNLERFKITIGCLLKSSDDIYSYKNTLRLKTSTSNLLDCKINDLFKKTEELLLMVNDMKHLTDVITMHPPEESFSRLRDLEVYGCKELRYLFTNAMANGLRRLEKLKVSNCDALESLIHGDESENNGVIKFHELRFLSLHILLNLESLCNTDIVVELPQLVELGLLGLPNFTSIFPDSEMQPFFKEQVAIPKLEKLEIATMDSLVQIWPSEITSGDEVQISMVRGVDVAWCDRLVNLFPCNPMPFLLNLEKLEVDHCDSLEVLFDIDLGLRKVEEVSSSLRSIHVMASENLTEVWRIKGANNSQVGGFQAVENIYIHGCKRFRGVFTPMSTNFDMRALLNIEMQDSLFNKALKSLQPNNNATKIALCGMGSVGKTRMMNDLVEAVEGMGMFDLVLKLNIGREANPIALQQAIAEYIGEDLAQTTIEAWAEDGKAKILVILDDLQKVMDLKDIRLPSPLPNGFKLLITSRDVDVCAQMGVEKNSIFRLGVVDDVEAKTLFFETVGLLEDEDPDLYKIGEEIIIRCGNFPVTLKFIASILKGNIKDKCKWEETLSLLQNHELEDIYDVLKIAFGMSYNNLKTDEEKAILFLSCFFPKDFDIPVEELMRYAWSLKLFPKVDTTLALARHRFNASVDVLKHANFFDTSDRVGCLKVQHYARDFVLSNFSQVTQASFDHGNMPEDAGESYERVFLNCTGTSEFPVALNYPNLKLLKLMGEEKLVKFPQNSYDRMENLEVVAYDRMVDPLLPSYSTNLRTLCLDSCSLTDDFSFLGSLINLEILSFAQCGIQKLPSIIGRLRRLKLLDVTGCVNLSIEDGVFQNMVNLEELYMSCDGSKAICFTDANYEEFEILVRQLCALEVEFYDNKFHPKDGSFEKLEKFNISIYDEEDKDVDDDDDNDDDDADADADADDRYNKALKLVSNCSEVVECKINMLFEKTERLYLQVKDMKTLEDVSVHHYSFSNLEKLVVCGCTNLTFLFTVQVASGLTKLESLEVSLCPVLETLIHGESGGGGSVIKLPKLNYVSFRELPMLMRLCDMDNRIELQQLAMLRLEGLPNFTSIYPDHAMHSFFNPQVQIPNLDRLMIVRMEKLIQIWPCEEQVNNNVSMLTGFTVEGCDSLVNLFPRNPLPFLNNLEWLDVFDCCSVEVIFNMDLIRAAGAHTSSLCSIQLNRLEKLREIWRIEGGNNSSSGLAISCFQAIRTLKIYNCHRFRDVYTPKNISFVMNAHAEVL